MPIWYQPDLDEPRTILEAVGLTVRISSNNGIWTDLGADGGGLIGLHTGPPLIELSFEYADDLAASVTEAGYPASVVDEAYNRTLVVATPDDWTLRVNGAQDDLHGYTAALGAPPPRRGSPRRDRHHLDIQQVGRVDVPAEGVQQLLVRGPPDKCLHHG